MLQGVELTRLSAVINALVMAGLVWAGALSFKRVVKSESAQLVYCMQVCSPQAVARGMASVELTAGQSCGCTWPSAQHGACAVQRSRTALLVCCVY